MNTDDTTEESGMTTVPMRSGMMVRVVNPNSQHYGSTGHLLGRNEQREDYWLVRITTTSSTVNLLGEELILVR